MPHIIVEHSVRLFDVPTQAAFLKALHSRVAEEPSVDIRAIKTRSIPLEDVIVGDDSMDDLMLHITIKLLPGRSIEVRKALSLDALHIARAFLERCDKSTCAISVDIAEMTAETYSK